MRKWDDFLSSSDSYKKKHFTILILFCGWSKVASVLLLRISNYDVWNFPVKTKISILCKTINVISSSSYYGITNKKHTCVMSRMTKNDSQRNESFTRHPFCWELRAKILNLKRTTCATTHSFHVWLIRYISYQITISTVPKYLLIKKKWSKGNVLA